MSCLMSWCTIFSVATVILSELDDDDDVWKSGKVEKFLLTNGCHIWAGDGDVVWMTAVICTYTPSIMGTVSQWCLVTTTTQPMKPDAARAWAIVVADIMAILTVHHHYHRHQYCSHSLSSVHAWRPFFST